MASHHSRGAMRPNIVLGRMPNLTSGSAGFTKELPARGFEPRLLG